MHGRNIIFLNPCASAKACNSIMTTNIGRIALCLSNIAIFMIYVIELISFKYHYNECIPLYYTLLGAHAVEHEISIGCRLILRKRRE